MVGDTQVCGSFFSTTAGVAEGVAGPVTGNVIKGLWNKHLIIKSNLKTNTLWEGLSFCLLTWGMHLSVPLARDTPLESYSLSPHQLRPPK